MKALVWLTVLQSISVNAAPHRRRQICTATGSPRTEIATTTVPGITVTISSTAAQDPSTPTSEQEPGSVVEEVSTLSVVFQSVDTSQAAAIASVVAASTNPAAAQIPPTLTTQSPQVAASVSVDSSTSSGAAQIQPTSAAQSTQVVTDLSVVIVTTCPETDQILPTSTTQSPPVAASVSVVTASTDSGTVQILPTLSTQSPQTSGTVATGLNTSGHGTEAPVISTSISAPSSTISPTEPAISVTSSVTAGMTSEDIFQPVATDSPASVVGSRADHPVPRLGIQPQKSAIGTNKFYANFFLGSQTAASWTHPYSVAWSKGGGSSASWGMSIQHIDQDQRVFGPDPNANPTEFFINPIGIQSLVLSALELGASTDISIDTITAFSANINLLPSAGAQPVITFPLVQGMGFITGVYNGGTPIVQTGVFFNTVTRANESPKEGVTKYSIILDDGKTWLLYAYSPDGTPLDLTVVSNGLLQATSNFNGIIQIAKSTSSESEALYDAACGAYATTATLSGGFNGATGSYSLSFAKSGISNTTLVMFALPHHIESFSSSTTSAATGVLLNTTTKGQATAVVADSWTMTESLPTTMGFAPWSPSMQNQETASSLSAATLAAIQSVAASEVSQNMSAQTNLNSMYFSGKALAKFAQIVYTLSDIVGDKSLAQAGLGNLKDSFAVFAKNQQIYPLVYETAWGGVVSTATYVTGDSGADFGNTYYNDHHFHYGYFIYTAAVIGSLDPSWLTDNQAFVNTLVRDIANPSSLDPYFPVSRNFDWYHGHSWAHGLYETFDGKDEESSSEDSMSAYAIKMWGRTIGDSNMEARGNLQLAITARALQHYFLYTSDNTVEPSNFIGNKVSGILFENKIDHTTYFGTNIEYIQGIHMLPLLPSSTLTRTQNFVTQEWNTYFSNGRVDTVAGGWRGILYANLAIIDPHTSWSFFNNPNFDASLLDGGASQTWYMALAAGLGGAS